MERWDMHPTVPPMFTPSFSRHRSKSSCFCRYDSPRCQLKAVLTHRVRSLRSKGAPNKHARAFNRSITDMRHSLLSRISRYHDMRISRISDMSITTASSARAGAGQRSLALKGGGIIRAVSQIYHAQDNELGPKQPPPRREI
mmetsp:Transcript_41626/g.111606  ORF Transcript_41626/g.111606 Transcript_41626/m.111606 type:complete len:142 (+) Transcript_41626:466-891(+)